MDARICRSIAAFTSGTEVGNLETGETVIVVVTGLASTRAGAATGGGATGATTTGFFFAMVLTETVFFETGLAGADAAALRIVLGATFVVAFVAGRFAEVERELLLWRRCMDLPGGLGEITPKIARDPQGESRVTLSCSLRQCGRVTHLHDWLILPAYFGVTTS